MRRLGVMAALALLPACDFTDPSPIAGTWVATAWTIIPVDEPPLDVLDEGGSLTIVIASDHGTSGSMTVPATLTGGAAVTESMAGTATVNGNTVEFDQAADTFVRDVTWTILGNTLVASSTVAGLTLEITLTRQ